MRQLGSAAKHCGRNDDAVTPRKSLSSKKKKGTPSPFQRKIDSVFPVKTPDKQTYKTPDKNTSGKKTSGKKIRKKGE